MPWAGEGWVLEQQAGGRGCSRLFPGVLEGPTQPPHPLPSSPATGMLLALGTSVEDEFCQGVLTAPHVPQASPSAPSPAPAARLVPSPLSRRVQSHRRLRLASKPLMVPKLSLGSSWLLASWSAQRWQRGAALSSSAQLPHPAQHQRVQARAQGSAPLRRRSSSQTLA